MKEKSILGIKSFMDTKISEGIDRNVFTCAAMGYSNGTDRVFAYSKNPIPPLMEVPNSLSSIYDLASLHKTFVGIVLLQLVEKGLVTVETPIRSVIKIGNETWDQITLYHLLTNSLEFDLTGPDKLLHLMTLEDAHRTILNAKVSRLGTGWYYHNTTALVMGWLLEGLLNQPLDAILKERVFEKAGMHSTFFYSDIPQEKKVRVVPSEECPARGILQGLPQDGTTYLFATQKLNGKDHTPVGISGTFATIADLLAFGEFVISGAFVEPAKMHDRMLHNYLAAYDATFGFVFDVPRPHYIDQRYADETLYHTGHSGGMIHIQPRIKKVLVSLANPHYPNKKQGGKESAMYQWRQDIAKNLLA